MNSRDSFRTLYELRILQTIQMTLSPPPPELQLFLDKKKNLFTKPGFSPFSLFFRFSLRRCHRWKKNKKKKTDVPLFIISWLKSWSATSTKERRQFCSALNRFHWSDWLSHLGEIFSTVLTVQSTTMRRFPVMSKVTLPKRALYKVWTLTLLHVGISWIQHKTVRETQTSPCSHTRNPRMTPSLGTRHF